MAETALAAAQVAEMGRVAIDQIVVFASSGQAVAAVDQIVIWIETTFDLVVESDLVAGVID